MAKYKFNTVIISLSLYNFDYKEIDISNSNVTDEDIKKLIKAITIYKDRRISKLNLSNNKITVEGLKLLINSIGGNGFVLGEINIASNNYLKFGDLEELIKDKKDLKVSNYSLVDNCIDDFEKIKKSNEKNKDLNLTMKRKIKI